MLKAAPLRFLDFPDLGEVRAVLATEVPTSFRRHTHTTYCIGLVVEGSRSLQVYDQHLVVPAGNLFVLNHIPVALFSKFSDHLSKGFSGLLGFSPKHFPKSVQKRVDFFRERYGESTSAAAVPILHC